MERVFEVGPVFRAEKSDTMRHLTEFTGLDMEMAFVEHYHEVLDVLGELFVFIFDGLTERFRAELEIVKRQFPFEDLVYTKLPLRITFAEAVDILRKNGNPDRPELDDFNTAEEKKLGVLMRNLYNTDFYIIDKFPTAVRPFYTMPDPINPQWSNSYDIFVRGQEIMSGAQRVHDSTLLTQRAIEKGVDPASVQPYIDAFKYGAAPHAGGGIGLERILMLYCNLPDIRKTSMFPRDMYRLNP